jgi:hypothetical protein
MVKYLNINFPLGGGGSVGSAVGGAGKGGSREAPSQHRKAEFRLRHDRD